MEYIKKFKDLRITDTATVGGKNASLGQMISQLEPKGLRIPDGFAITADAYWHFLTFNNLVEPIKQEMNLLTDINDSAQLKKVGAAVRSMIEKGAMPPDLEKEIIKAYKELCAQYNQRNCDVAVRSSATAEDLPTASFAGQQESYLNVHGTKALIESVKLCMASLFTDRAIVYRVDKGFDHLKVALSVGVQKMIRSDLACSGVSFSLDTESGFKDVIMINASWGLGEMIVKGEVIPDEYLISKPMLEQGFDAIIKKALGDKQVKMVYTKTRENPTKVVRVPKEDMHLFCLSDAEILELARFVLTIEQHYTNLKGSWSPMDIEWAKDGHDGKLYIIQARPETVHSQEKRTEFNSYHLKNSSAQKVLTTGQSIGQKIVSGTVRIVKNVADIGTVQKGDILVTIMTDPDWVPVLKKCAGIITDKGGRTCHAAIVSRELGIPAIIGTSDGTTRLKNGQVVTIDCAQGSVGYVYEGAIEFDVQSVTLADIPKSPVTLYVNLAAPESAFLVSALPVDGVGLARLEFIIANTIKIHPLALIFPEKVTDKKIKKQIDEITAGYTDKKQFYIDQLAYGIATIAAAFYPKKVIARCSDFKSNEYRNLLGGIYFEAVEDNPMLGLRGASRYYHEPFSQAFELECAAFKKVRESMGLKNVSIMIPFVRTTDEAQKVIALLNEQGLAQGTDNLQLVMMVEVPSNVILIEGFSALFDGFSIGSNDLAQLTLGVDRDSAVLAALFDERDPAVKKMMSLAIEGALKNNKFIGICGQAPSDYPEVAQFLIEQGITSISLNPDAVIPFLMSRKKNGLPPCGRG